MRVVIDTGVVISAALLPRSIPRQAFDKVLRDARVLVSDSTIAELDDVFRRPKFNRYLSEELRLEFLAALVAAAEVVEITEEITACRDPKDDKFLSLAVSGKAGHIITGDGDLLILNPFRAVAVVTPQDFLALASKSSAP
jgi:uncharacterized protein